MYARATVMQYDEDGEVKTRTRVEYRYKLYAAEYESGHQVAGPDVEVFEVTANGQPYELTDEEHEQLVELHIGDCGRENYTGAWL